MDVLFILACSKTKIWDKKEIPRLKKINAKDAYRGKVFLAGKHYAEQLKRPYLILSGKHGLLHPDTKILNYDKKLSSNSDIQRIKQQNREQLNNMFEKYDLICLVGGNEYYNKVLQGYNDDKLLQLSADSFEDLSEKLELILNQNT